MEIQVIQNKIYEVRGRRVMPDFDLAMLYKVETKRLKEQVRRNIERFPDDFIFQLSKYEWNELVANCDQLPETIKHSYIIPLAFTQEGVAMLSGVLLAYRRPGEHRHYEGFRGASSVRYDDDRVGNDTRTPQTVGTCRRG